MKAKYWILMTLILFSIGLTSPVPTQMNGSTFLSCGSESTILDINILVQNDSRLNQIAEVLQSYLPHSCIGVDTVKVVDDTELASRMWEYGNGEQFIPDHEDGGFDIAIMRINDPFAPDIVLDLDDDFSDFGNASIEFVNYYNETLENLQQQFYSTNDTEQRRDIAYRIQEILYEDQPSSTIAYNSDMSMQQQSVELNTVSRTSISGIEMENLNNGPSRIEVLFNMDNPIIGTGSRTPLGFENPDRADDAARNIRKAISHTIPKSEIIEELLNGDEILGVTS